MPGPIRNRGKVVLLRRIRRTVVLAALILPATAASAQAAPEVLDPNLAVRPAVSGLVTPISIAFLGPGEMLVLGFVWNGSALTFDRNIIRIRAIQQDASQPERGSHDGGVLIQRQLVSRLLYRRRIS